MLPTGHAALAYVCYAGVAALTGRRLPATDALVPLLFASQLPDLIDKPLAYLGVLQSGRSLAHSLFAFVVLAVAVGLACRALARAADSDLLDATPVAFAVGYATHLAGDSYRALLAGRYGEASFLLYPLVPPRTYPNDGVAPWVRLRRIYLEGGPDAVGPVVLAAVVLFVGVRAWAYWRREPPASR